MTNDSLIDKIEHLKDNNATTNGERYICDKAIAIIRQHEADSIKLALDKSDSVKQDSGDLLQRGEICDDDLIEAICMQSCKRIAAEDGIRSCASACETCKRELRSFVPELRPYLRTTEPVSRCQINLESLQRHQDIFDMGVKHAKASEQPWCIEHYPNKCKCNEQPDDYRAAFHKWWMARPVPLEFPNSGDSATGFEAGWQAARALERESVSPKTLMKWIRKTVHWHGLNGLSVAEAMLGEFRITRIERDKS